MLLCTGCTAEQLDESLAGYAESFVYMPPQGNEQSPILENYDTKKVEPIERKKLDAFNTSIFDYTGIREIKFEEKAEDRSVIVYLTAFHSPNKLRTKINTWMCASPLSIDTVFSKVKKLELYKSSPYKGKNYLNKFLDYAYQACHDKKSGIEKSIISEALAKIKGDATSLYSKGLVIEGYSFDDSYENEVNIMKDVASELSKNGVTVVEQRNMGEKNAKSLLTFMDSANSNAATLHLVIFCHPKGSTHDNLAISALPGFDKNGWYLLYSGFETAINIEKSVAKAVSETASKLDSSNNWVQGLAGVGSEYNADIITAICEDDKKKHGEFRPMLYATVPTVIACNGSPGSMDSNHVNDVYFAGMLAGGILTAINRSWGLEDPAPQPTENNSSPIQQYGTSDQSNNSVTQSGTSVVTYNNDTNQSTITGASGGDAVRASTSSGDYIKVGSTAYTERDPTHSATGVTLRAHHSLAGKISWKRKTVELYEVDSSGGVGKLMGTYVFDDTGYGRSTGRGVSTMDGHGGESLGDIETGETIDIYMNSESECDQWGRRNVYMKFIS